MVDNKPVISDKNRYKPDTLLSYNRVLNFVLGARGIGKTFGWTIYVINRYLKYGEQFIYLRRYKPEFKKVNMFFDAITNEGYFEGHKFEVKNGKFLIDDDTAGYYVPLSTALQEKSSNYPRVTTLLFDEFLIEKGNTIYIPNEPEKLLNFMDTVVRTRTNFRTVCLSNAVSVANPYFLYFDIELDLTQEFTATKSIVTQIPNSREFAKERAKTPAGELFASTPYGQFALNNEFTGDTIDFIARRSPESKFFGSVHNNGQTYGFWLDYNLQLVYASNKTDPSFKAWAVNSESHNDNTLLADSYKTVPVLNQVVRAYKKGYLRFEDQKIKHGMNDVLKRLNIR